MSENFAFVYGVCVGSIAMGIFGLALIAVRSWLRRREADQIWEDGQ